MTSKLFEKKNYIKTDYFLTLGCVALCFLMLVLSKPLKDGVYSGFLLAFQNVLPTLFPFFILSDIWSSFFRLSKKNRLSSLFSSFFKINESAITAFLCGLICGFPVGVKMGCDLYRKNLITKNELERFCGFANNPSAAFVISGIGLGLLNNMSYGIILYFSTVFSALLTGFIFRKNGRKSLNQNDNSRQNYNFIDSVKSAAFSSINVASYIILSSAILAIISPLVQNYCILTLISPFIEVSNAVSIISTYSQIGIYHKLIVISFAVAFSGFSVHMQAFSFMPKEISRIKYLYMKLCQGLLSSAITAIILIAI
ncbi:MAG: hypothetical protein IJX97_05235 [Clostridia bacterium]|nr:hypothetical protein [Clostridia bacterium]